MAPKSAPIHAVVNEHVPAILDILNDLQNMKVMDNDFKFPSIVVVGEQSSGKSSLLSSLTGVSLPRGGGTVTRVPLLINMRNVSDVSGEEMYLDYRGNRINTSDDQVVTSIKTATTEIAGKGSFIVDHPLTLVVKKIGISNLNIIDLPGIIQIAPDDCSDDIIASINDMVVKYIDPVESIILNVLSAESDFATCGSIRLVRNADPMGERTLTIITKSDRNPEKLFEMISTAPSSKNINVCLGLGFVCVRNRIPLPNRSGYESCQEALQSEQELFQEEPLSSIDRSRVGMPSLALKLVQIQTSILSKCLPSLLRNVELKLLANMIEFETLPRHIHTAIEASNAFTRILKSTQSSLKDLLIIGDYSEYPNQLHMHALTRLREMLDSCYQELISHPASSPTDYFLVDEISILRESLHLITLPLHPPHSALLSMLKSKVESISSIPLRLMDRVWDYIKEVLVAVLSKNCEMFPQLKITSTSVFEKLLAQMKSASETWIMQILSMEKQNDYTCNPEFFETYNSLMSLQTKFVNSAVKESNFQLGTYGIVDIQHISNDSSRVLLQAFELRAKMIAYWNVILCRFQDYIGLHITFAIRTLLFVELEAYLDNDPLSKADGGLENILHESPIVAEKRKSLEESIDLLEKAKHVIFKVIQQSERVDVDGGLKE